MTDLITKLRQMAGEGTVTHTDYQSSKTTRKKIPICGEAATELLRLHAQVAELKAALRNFPDPKVIRWNAIERAKRVATQAIETADPHEARGAERQREFTIAKLIELQNEFLGDAPPDDIQKPPLTDRPATIIVLQTREDRLQSALYVLARAVPSTKGMAPRDRAQRLHAELERRIKVAKEAVKQVHSDAPQGDEAPDSTA